MSIHPCELKYIININHRPTNIKSINLLPHENVKLNNFIKMRSLIKIYCLTYNSHISASHPNVTDQATTEQPKETSKTSMATHSSQLTGIKN